MTIGRRRIFWGHSLPQAIARASRYYAVPADRLAYRVHEKRHGFVKHPRTVLIEIDPLAPLRPEAASAPALASAPVAPGPAPGREPKGRERPAAPEPMPNAPAPRAPVARPERPAREPESWDAPDEESLFAATEAARKIARFAGLELDPEARAAGDRLEVELTGADAERLRQLGYDLLGEIEHLLPRAVQTLSGRHVRCRLEAAGLREERERSLRARAREAAERAIAGGREELLEPLNPADRRIVHLELAERGGITTESVGSGFLKRVKIVPPATLP